jgi:pyruvyltransferase
MKRISELNYDNVPGVKASLSVLAKALFRKFYISPREKIQNSLWIRRFGIMILRRPIKVRIYSFGDQTQLNFGDELSLDIISHMFNRKTEKVTNDNDADLFAIGSVITWGNRSYTADRKVYFWGSGFNGNPKLEQPVNRNFIFCSCRGKMTRNSLPEGYSGIPLGDPGLLSNLVFTDKIEKKDLIGIIPHGNDMCDRLLNKAKILPNRYKIIWPNCSPKEVINDMKECKVIFSSSLHGLICADSFGIPNMHIKISDRLYGGLFKFKDYYTSIGRRYKNLEPKKIYSDKAVNEVINSYEPIKNLDKIQKNIIDAFPYKMVSSKS